MWSMNGGLRRPLPETMYPRKVALALGLGFPHPSREKRAGPEASGGQVAPEETTMLDARLSGRFGSRAWEVLF